MTIIISKNSVALLEADIVIDEQYTIKNRKTINPVEIGSEVVDNVISDPDQVNMSIAISNVSFVSGGKSDLSGFGEKHTRSAIFADDIIALLKKKEPFDVHTSLKIFENMLLLSLSISRSKRTYNSLIAQVSFEELLIAESDFFLLDIPANADISSDAVTRASASVDEDEKEVEEISKIDEKKKYKSILTRILE